MWWQMVGLGPKISVNLIPTKEIVDSPWKTCPLSRPGSCTEISQCQDSDYEWSYKYLAVFRIQIHLLGIWIHLLGIWILLYQAQYGMDLIRIRLKTKVSTLWKLWIIYFFLLELWIHKYFFRIRIRGSVIMNYISGRPINSDPARNFGSNNGKNKSV